MTTPPTNRDPSNWLLWSDVPKDDWRRQLVEAYGLDIPIGYWHCVKDPTGTREQDFGCVLRGEKPTSGYWTLCQYAEAATPWMITAHSEEEFRRLHGEFRMNVQIVDFKVLVGQVWAYWHDGVRPGGGPWVYQITRNSGLSDVPQRGAICLYGPNAPYYGPQGRFVAGT